MRKIQFILFLLISSSALLAQTGQVSNDTVVLRVGNFSLTKAEYEKLILGFDRASGATTTGASNQSARSGRDVARLLALVSEAQRRKIDQDERMQALLRVRGYTLLANALLPELEKEIKKDERGTRALWASPNNSYIQVEARQILIRYQGVKAEKPGAKGFRLARRQPHEQEAVYLRQWVDLAGDGGAGEDGPGVLSAHGVGEDVTAAA